MFRSLIAVWVLLAALVVGVQAQAACPAGTEFTPDSAFTLNGTTATATTATHALTGLTWKRCFQGQGATTCPVGTKQMTWQAALVAAAADNTDGGGWRLPNKKELESIVEWCGSSPAINQTVFPGTVVAAYWSASSIVADPSSAWNVAFSDGGSNANVKSDAYYLRLVRGGQPGAPTIGTAMAGNGSASVTFTAPGSDGYSTITGYTATSSPSGVTVSCTASPCTVAGLSNGTAYTFTVTATNGVGTGPASAASNSVTPGAPAAPEAPTAAAGDTQASVTFTAPASNGSDITSYTATSNPGGLVSSGCTASPCTVTGLTNGTAYTFTVTATNALGTGAPSAASNSVTPATVPGAPTIGTATAGNGSARVSFTAPANNGSAITGYTATSSPGNISSSGCTASPCMVTGLSNGTGYTFTVTATNGVGTGAASAASNSVTPVVTHTVTFNNNNGSGTMTAQTSSVAANLTTNTFTRAGYTFSGWNTVAVGGGTAYADGVSYAFAADVTLYAQWSALPTKTVTFNNNGGSGTMTAQTNNVAANLTTNTFTRAGYTFSGWNTVAVGGGTAYADGASYAFAADVTLYAQWSALPTKTVTFNNNGGTGSMTAQTNNVAANLATNTFTRAGYTFSGWNTVAVGGGTAYVDGASYDFAADVTLYAQWTIDSSTVIFTPQSGVALGSTATSNTVTLAGISDGSQISISGGSYSINSGSYTAANGTVSNNDTVTVQQTASSSNGVLTQATLTIGGVSATFDVTTPGRLPDTGIDTCYNSTAADTKTVDGVVVKVLASDPASIARDGIVGDVGLYPRQDCRYGRDVAAAAGAVKTGAGEKGLDYTKIANNGSIVVAGTALGTGDTDWACTQDNITGLMWEVKTDDGGLRDKDHKYTWYSSNAATNGGNVGAVSGGTCETAGRCDTEKFVADVNAANLCGHADWRMPTRRELRTLVLYDGSNPSIDSMYFPNIHQRYWSATSLASGFPTSPSAWYVDFTGGQNHYTTKNSLNKFSVRLVRGGQF